MKPYRYKPLFPRYDILPSGHIYQPATHIATSGERHPNIGLERDCETKFMVLVRVYGFLFSKKLIKFLRNLLLTVMPACPRSWRDYD
ncbi:unnamed protein product, partial [Brenthis ino]